MILRDPVSIKAVLERCGNRGEHGNAAPDLPYQLEIVVSFEIVVAPPIWGKVSLWRVHVEAPVANALQHVLRGAVVGVEDDQVEMLGAESLDTDNGEGMACGCVSYGRLGDTGGTANSPWC